MLKTEALQQYNLYIQDLFTLTTATKEVMRTIKTSDVKRELREIKEEIAELTKHGVDDDKPYTIVINTEQRIREARQQRANNALQAMGINGNDPCKLDTTTVEVDDEETPLDYTLLGFAGLQTHLNRKTMSIRNRIRHILDFLFQNSLRLGLIELDNEEQRNFYDYVLRKYPYLTLTLLSTNIQEVHNTNKISLFGLNCSIITRLQIEIENLFIKLHGFRSKLNDAGIVLVESIFTNVNHYNHGRHEYLDSLHYNNLDTIDDNLVKQAFVHALQVALYYIAECNELDYTEYSNIVNKIYITPSNTAIGVYEDIFGTTTDEE